MLVARDRGISADQDEGGDESIKVVAIEARDAGRLGRGASIGQESSGP